MKKPNRAGRPNPITQEKIDKLEIAFSRGATDAMACVFAEVPTSTFYDYCKAHPEFQARKELLKQKLPLKAIEVIGKALQNNDAKVAQWVLEHKCKEEFGNTFQLTGGDGQAIVPTINIIGVAPKNDNK